ncbi:MAG: hypothetical protein R6U57_02910 [Anaerolineales bacterium]
MTKHKSAVPILATFLFFCLLILAGCDSARGVPEGALSAAYSSSQFCPVDGCGVELGPSTTKLPFSDPDIQDRWCIEVIFTRGGMEFNMAVDVVQVGQNPEEQESWSVRERIYESDCEVFE